MNNLANNTGNTPQLPTGTWSVALRDQLAKEAIARMGAHPTEEHKLAVMAELVEKLQALRDYDHFDPKQMESVVLKRRYRQVEMIDVGSGAQAFQVLPNGTIVTGRTGGGIQILAKEGTGDWESQFLGAHEPAVNCLHVLSDRQIVLGANDKTIQIWSKDGDSRWSAEVIGTHGDDGHAQSIQALPDGRVISRSWNNTIRVWSKGDDGRWRYEGLSGYEGRISCFQALPDGRIVSGCTDGVVRIWTKGGDDRWAFEALNGDVERITCLHVLPDGRIVSGSFGGLLRIWSKGGNGGWRSEVVSEHAGPVRCVQALPDGRIVSGSWDNTIQIWTEMPDTRVVSALRGWISGRPATKWYSERLGPHPFGVSCIQVLPDGRIFSGAQDSTIRIWDGERDQGKSR